ncbi:anti-sigma regulatory factor (Ser/Thr protein kinase) [Pseudonocardia cypriaca]|uniref:Anti-sigma regulatory factor (Ser/Thr protein kinase) n=2 Tax=Pseudonocardia cypriaca TaxID=882449 RepID=A0A543GB36_9PSEU|nr:anti-sigma regulatory factor (Ser/Thr protein kinase) [Pseudonocardia cypriaca]
MVLMADPVSLSVVRERFRRWLGALCWPPREVDDIVMAVNEAVTSAVEHIHPSIIGAEVRVAARQYAEPDGGRRILVAVAGGEHWTPEPDGFEGPGLLMIHACMDAIEVAREDEGITMLLTSAKVPPFDQGFPSR